MKKCLCVILPFLVATLVQTGCSTTPPKPLYSAAGFQPESMDTVYILPVVDSRADKKLGLNVEPLQRIMFNDLKRKRYHVEVVRDRSLVDGINDEDLKNPTQDWVKAAGPTDARWVMVLAVTELSRKLTFGSTANAEVVLVVLDKQTGTVVWRDKALGQAGQGGIIGMFMVSMMEDEAMNFAMYGIMVKFPKKPKGS